MSDLSDKLITASLVVLGAVILAIHVGLFIYNVYLFNIFVCLYIMFFAILVTIFLYKKKDCFESPSGAFNTLTYFSIYTISIQALLIILSFIFLVRRNSSSMMSSYSPSYSSY